LADEPSVKKLLLALAVMVLLVPPATPMPLVAVCCADEECQVEDCRMECGTESELPTTTRSVSNAPGVVGDGKAVSAPLTADLAEFVLAAARPIDKPNLSAGLRPPLRN
jgi:hypothetical protein